MNFNKSFTEIKFSKKEYKGILKNLKAIHKLLSKPKVWIQEEYFREAGPKEVYNKKLHKYELVDGPAQMCLMGANNQVDGIHESNTDVFMCLNLPEKYSKQFINGFKDAVQDSKDLYDKVDIDTLKSLIYSKADGEDGGEGYVESFNDHASTTLKIVLSWLSKCIKKAERLAA